MPADAAEPDPDTTTDAPGDLATPGGPPRTGSDPKAGIDPSIRLPVAHTYDDALARLDAVATIDAFDAGELSPAEVTRAAIERAQRIDPQIAAVMFERYDQARTESRRPRTRRGSFEGMPTFIKDMVPVGGLPCTWGAAALEGAPPQKRTKGVALDMEHMGMTIVGTSTMPEWGFVPSTEFPVRESTHNPWNLAHSIGGSSGGAAALVAAGVVPVAHAVDGGGSIRIPAACGGLVGLKPSLGRLRRHGDERNLPLSISVDGVVSRTVRDTARWYAEMECVFRPRNMIPMGEVTGPPSRRLKIGVLGEIPGIIELDAPTRDTLRSTADLLSELGHHVEDADVPVEPEQFRDDFIFYYRFLVFAATKTARIGHGSHFDPAKLTPFSQGMAASFAKRPGHLVGVAKRLRQVRSRIAELHQSFDLVLSPTVSTVPPELGYIGAKVGIDEMLPRLAAWMPYTPLANAGGTPAITLPMGFDDATGIPVGAMLSSTFGDDAALLRIALELEDARPWDLARLH